MICPKCKTDNPKGAMHCSNCATQLCVNCPKCPRKELPIGALFCSDCGYQFPIAKPKKARKPLKFPNVRTVYVVWLIIFALLSAAGYYAYTFSRNGIYQYNGVAPITGQQIDSVLTQCDIAFVFVEGGRYKPTFRGETTVSDFYIGKYEITRQQWRSLMGTDPSGAGTNEPVSEIRWEDAVLFCNSLSKKYGLECCYKFIELPYFKVQLIQDAIGFRLPTEAEWEYAARGGKQSKGYSYAGSNSIDEVAWYGNKKQEVGKKKPNELGIFDMSGNVGEWCTDYYKSSFDTKDCVNPIGDNWSIDNYPYFVFRNGGENSESCLINKRDNRWCDYSGFRIVLSTNAR